MILPVPIEVSHQDRKGLTMIYKEYERKNENILYIDFHDLF